MVNAFLKGLQAGQQLREQPYRNAFQQLQLQDMRNAFSAQQALKQHGPAIARGEPNAFANALAGGVSVTDAYNVAQMPLAQAQATRADSRLALDQANAKRDWTLQNMGALQSAAFALIREPDDARRQAAYTQFKTNFGPMAADWPAEVPAVPELQNIANSLLQAQQYHDSLPASALAGGTQAQGVSGGGDLSLGGLAAAYQQSGLAFPISADAQGARISSRYGMRDHPDGSGQKMHTGLDIAAPKGTAVGSMAPGTVLAVEQQGGYGTLVTVDHGDGFTSLYAHLGGTDVQKGDRVTAGQTIGTVGQSGNATGPSVHIETRRHGQHVDPLQYGQDGGPRSAQEAGALHKQDPIEFARTRTGQLVTSGLPSGFALGTDGRPRAIEQTDEDGGLVLGQGNSVDDRKYNFLRTVLDYSPAEAFDLVAMTEWSRDPVTQELGLVNLRTRQAVQPNYGTAAPSQQPPAQQPAAEPQQVGTLQSGRPGQPIIDNGDGTFSTERSITVQDPRLNNGQWTNVPSLWDGQQLSQDEAIQRAAASGQQFKGFPTLEAALQSARSRSQEMGGHAEQALDPERQEQVLQQIQRAEGVPTLFELANDTAGLRSWMRNAWTRIGPMIDAGAGYPATTTTRQYVRAAQQQLITALSISARNPVTEQERLREQININPDAFDSVEALQARQVAVDQLLRQKLANQKRISVSRFQSGKVRQEARARAAAIEHFLDILGVPPVPNSQEEYDALPRRTLYWDEGKGKSMVKGGGSAAVGVE